ncbi:MAG: hypothetical protein NTX66_03685 [Candidatus Falkowbacteria bacterium]|nr:hypothetical protein [Candidatus Falkowbacteria bacterium]
MKYYQKIIALSALFLCLSGGLAMAQGTIDPNFNPNNILGDNDLYDYSSMSLAEIQSFLQNKGSYLANYQTLNTHGTLKSAAEIIYDAARNNYDCSGVTLSDNPTETEKSLKCQHITTVNPKFLLVLLQKEASLIEDSNPIQAHLDWATGYGCPDSLACNPYYKGFGKQVNSASLQFLAYMNEQDHYTYKAGQTYIFNNPYGTICSDPIAVTPANRATAALYNYTPHVYNGNYNFYKIWQRYFPKMIKRYPDGSVLQAKDDTSVFLIEGGKKRPFVSKSVLMSRFNTNQIIVVDKSVLDNYEPGTPIKFPNYSIVKSPKNNVYLLVGNEKRGIVSWSVFKKIGFNPAEIVEATFDELNNYQNGLNLTATSTYPLGALLQDTKTGGIYFAENGTKAPILDKLLITLKFKGKKIIKTSAKELNTYKTVDPILLSDGELVKSTANETIYLISNGQKRPFASLETLKTLGYNPDNISTISPQLLYYYPLGEIINN